MSGRICSIFLTNNASWLPQVFFSRSPPTAIFTTIQQSRRRISPVSQHEPELSILHPSTQVSTSHWKISSSIIGRFKLYNSEIFSLRKISNCSDSTTARDGMNPCSGYRYLGCLRSSYSRQPHGLISGTDKSASILAILEIF